MYEWSKTQRITIMGMFTAIIFLLTFTPLGFPQIPLIGSATVIHIPVIIGAILLGPKYGAVLGFMFGLSSMIFASTQSLALNAFAFTPFRPVPGTDNGSPWALLVAFVPRIMVGILSPLVFMGLMKLLPKKGGAKRDSLALTVAAFVGSMTNTLLVLHFLYFIFREPWSYAREASAAATHAEAATIMEYAAAAWQNAYAAATEAVYYAGGLWETAAEYARQAVVYEQAAQAVSGRAIAAPQITYAFVVGIITGFGVPEALAAVVIVPAVCLALFAVAGRMSVRRRYS